MSSDCLGGGIGRRVGFKIQFFRECGFDSHPRYLIKTQLFKKIRVAFFYARSSSLIWTVSDSKINKYLFKKVFIELSVYFGLKYTLVRCFRRLCILFLCIQINNPSKENIDLRKHKFLFSTIP